MWSIEDNHWFYEFFFSSPIHALTMGSDDSYEVFGVFFDQSIALFWQFSYLAFLLAHLYIMLQV